MCEVNEGERDVRTNASVSEHLESVVVQCTCVCCPHLAIDSMAVGFQERFQCRQQRCSDIAALEFEMQRHSVQCQTGRVFSCWPSTVLGGRSHPSTEKTKHKLISIDEQITTNPHRHGLNCEMRTAHTRTSVHDTLQMLRRRRVFFDVALTLVHFTHNAALPEQTKTPALEIAARRLSP